MSILQAPKNPPVRQDHLLFLISILDKQDKVEFVRQFKEDFEQQVEERKLSKAGYNKLLQGYAPSDDRMLQVIEADEEAKKWLIQRVKEKAKKALEIIAVMEEG